MAMPLTVPSYSIEDLERFPDDGNRYELLDGVLLVTPAPLPPHQVVISRLQAALMAYVQTPGRAYVVGPGAVEIAPKTHLEPDILVFPADQPLHRKWSAIQNWWLAVEVFSESSVIYDRDFKSGLAIAADQMTGSHVPFNRHQIGEEAMRPQDRIAALALECRHHDQGTAIGIKCRNQTVYQCRINAGHIAEANNSAIGLRGHG